MRGINCEFLLKIRNRLQNLRFVEMEFAEEKMSERQLRIQCYRLSRVLLGDGIKFLPQQNAGGKQIGGWRIHSHVEHASERLASLGVVLILNVGHAQDVGGVDVGAWIPSLNFFQQR